MTGARASDRPWGYVQLVDSGGDLRVLGDLAHYRSLEHKSYVTGHAELVLRMGTDTLYLHGDTVFTATDSTGKRITAGATSDSFAVTCKVFATPCYTPMRTAPFTCTTVRPFGAGTTR